MSGGGSKVTDMQSDGGSKVTDMQSGGGRKVTDMQSSTCDVERQVYAYACTCTCVVFFLLQLISISNTRLSDCSANCDFQKQQDVTNN